MTLKSPPPGLSHWSTREIADRVGVSHTTVHRIWKAHALQPHRVETFKFTTDPNAEAKIRDIVGLYLNPPTNAVVVSLDEKTQIQALERTQPILRFVPISRHDRPRLSTPRADQPVRRLEIASGKIIGECAERHTGADFLRFLKVVNRRFRNQALHVILDNSSTHSTPT